MGFLHEMIKWSKFLDDGSDSGGVASVSEKEVNFYDYDGTCLYAYTVDEAQALTELPALPEREGLICQGWNYDLETIKAYNRRVNVGATYITDDGTTRIYITLQEGRTSPMLGVCPNGTVTVDWGDGTEPDTLTGTSTSTVQWTPNHEYAVPGDYVIRLTVDGEIWLKGYFSSGSHILRHSSEDKRINCAYSSAVRKIEIGNGVMRLDDYSLKNCYKLASIVIPNGTMLIDQYAFENCDSLKSIVIPDGTTSIFGYVFYHAHSLVSVIYPDGVGAFSTCLFCNCYSLTSIVIPESVTEINNKSFQNCHSLTSLVIPESVTEIASEAFYYCYGMRYYDFTKHNVVPTLSNANAFNGIATDCEIRVPAALYDEWIAATNWATYASQIVAV